jgi:hypothetical protein
MDGTKVALRNEIRQLAEEAFYHKLISGYGDGADSDEFQIIIEGKPRHFPLQEARSFLNDLLFSSSIR